MTNKPRTSQAAGFLDTNLREMMDQAVAQCPIGVALLDTQMRHLRLNAMMCRILGLGSEAGGLNVRLTDLISTPETEACVACARVGGADRRAGRVAGHLPAARPEAGSRG